MSPFIFPLGAGFLGLGLVAAMLALLYPVLWVWMVVDGILRTDEEYPGVSGNRKVLWVLGMVLVHPVVIVYFFAVYLRLRRSPHVASAPYTAAAGTPAPPVPQYAPVVVSEPPAPPA
jgi:hypothetical protein